MNTCWLGCVQSRLANMSAFKSIIYNSISHHKNHLKVSVNQLPRISSWILAICCQQWVLDKGFINCMWKDILTGCITMCHVIRFSPAVWNPPTPTRFLFNFYYVHKASVDLWGGKKTLQYFSWSATYEIFQSPLWRMFRQSWAVISAVSHMQFVLFGHHS